MFLHPRDAWRLAVVIAAAATIGLLIGEVTLCLLAAAAVYIAWLHLKLGMLLTWMRDRKAHEPPEIPGAFEDLTVEVDYLRERHKKRKKKLANYLKQFQEATRALPDATAVLDANDEVRWANIVARRRLNIRWPEDVGQRITNLIRLPELREFIDSGGDGECAIEIVEPPEPARHLSVLLVPYGVDQRLLVARDVTQLHRANEIRSDFVANVSHELRTPITVFRGYLENLTQQRERCPEGWLPALEHMLSHAERMGTLVEELLLLSRLEQEDRVPNPGTVRVSDLIADIHARARELSGSREHLFSLEIEPNLSIRGEQAELNSAFSNIVYNAVNYTPERGIVRIRWYRDEEGAHFEVEDNGIGIAEDQLPRLTERFYRVDSSRSGEPGGTGLGLAIAKHVLSRHGAALSITSTPGRGSTFRCDFPQIEIVEQPAADGEVVRDAG